ncbi:peptidase S15 [Thermomonospora curvata DSM] [Mycolicibacterium parafortuitum]|uniref:Peptidase S15 [Thermomonospora curvata DSM] n=2 Tax=Mycolicibacterium parafortuitum TaxID=39692 RepID=A0A375YGF8_MYCPF|nr:peptidase S15 [Thermomonospora curvata DSM] [Mycolicibacterium parafortuitum]
MISMRAGTYVGRVGGLAVALGIGAAVLIGAGAAAADDDTGASQSQSSQSAKPSARETASVSAGNDDAGPSADPGDSSTADTKKSTEDNADERDVEDTTDVPVDDEPDVDPDAEESAAEPDPTDVQPAKVVTARLTRTDAVTEDDTPAPETPTAPAITSLMTSVAAAGREATQEPSSDRATADAPHYPIPTDVVVTEWTPPLEWLQQIPLFGRYVMTPLVGLLHNIPLIGDVLHPVFGFPIDHDAPPGTPRARSFRVTSFDGTRIFVNFMPAKGLQAGESAPTILNGPGVSLPGSTTLELDVDSLLPDDVIGIGALRTAGYNVVTWDPRGEWRSEGKMQLQSPDFEGRDVSHIISYLATLDEVQTVNGDPKIGMVGASYGGGIQLSTATIDHRIDAIVPTIAWNSLAHSLFPNGAVRNGWGNILSAALILTLSRPNERVLPATITGVLTGKVAQSDLDLFESLNFADRLADITAPTLLIQGTVDTLLPLSQADLNARALIAAGTTTKVVWYCGGHGTCLSSVNNGDVVVGRTLDWLDRHVKGEDIDTGAQFEWVDQHGDWYSSDTYPAPQDLTPITAQRTEDQSMLYFPFVGGSGPNPLIITRGLIATLLGLPSGAPAVNAVNLKVSAASDVGGATTHVVGAPEVTLTYSGTGTAKHVWAQIVDDETGLVLGNHTTPIPVQLDGNSHTVTVSLEQVAHTLAPGQTLTVQIVTSSFAFLNFYSGGAITIDELSVRLPTLAASGAAQTVAA